MECGAQIIEGVGGSGRRIVRGLLAGLATAPPWIRGRVSNQAMTLAVAALTTSSSQALIGGSQPPRSSTLPVAPTMNRRSVW